jgi:cytochrome P450
MITSPSTQPVKRFLINIRNMSRFYRDPLDYMTWMQRTYGKMSSSTIGNTTMYAFFTPEAVRAVLIDHAHSFSNREINEPLVSFLGDGLLTIDGDLHKQHRHLLLPAFHRKHVESYHDTMALYTQRLLDSWEAGQQVDMLHEMQRLTLSIASKTLFNVEIGDHTEELGKAFTTVLSRGNDYWVWWNIPFMNRNLPFTPYGRLYQAKARIDRFVDEIIAEHRASSEDSGDIVSMLLAARDEDGNKLSDRQVRDHAITILLAGHETTANALTWALYLLSRNEPVREKLLNELSKVLAGRTPTIEDLANLPYLEMVFNETLRLYPPVWILLRRAIESVEVDGTNVSKGDVVWLSQWVMHRMPEYFLDPETFMPERFDAQNGMKLSVPQTGFPQFAFFPFGGGSRHCLGMTFAYMEARIVLAMLLQRFTPLLVDGFSVVPRPLVTLRPRHGMQMRIEETRVPVTMQ